MKKFVTKTSALHIVCENGFTLAEVLITLGIIGIVSALTLPVLIQNINGHKYRNQFKKSFSTLSQAVKLAQEAYELSFAMLDQTCEQTGIDANPRTSRSMCAMLNGTLKGATYVGPASDIYKEKDIKIGDYPISDYLVYRLSDGSLVGFYKDLKTCTIPTGTQLTESVLTGTGALKNCLGFIDVNGDKNPNDLVQGTSADSISWLFGLPTYADPSFGYGGCDDAGRPYPNNTSVRCYSYEDKKYVYMTYEEFNEAINYTYVQGYGLPQAGNYSYGYADCTRTSNGYNCYSYHDKTYMDISEEDYSYSEIYDSQGHRISAATQSAAGYNAQGQWGYGDEYKYNHRPEMYGTDGSFCGPTYCVDAEGNMHMFENSMFYYGYGEVFQSIQANPCQQDDHCLSVNASSETTDKCSLSSFDPSAVCRVENKSGQISDIFPIVFHDGVVEPASGPARVVLHTTK